MKPNLRPHFNFKDLIDPTILITIAILLAVGVIVSMFFADKVKTFKSQYRSKYLVYLFSVLLIFAVVSFLGQSKIINSLFGEFVFYQIIILFLGIIHVILYRIYFTKFENENIWFEVVFNLIITIFSIIPFIIVYTYLNGLTYTFYMVACLLVFIVPTLVYATFNKSVSIPAKISKTWAFPPEGSFPEPRDDEFRDSRVITFVFYKTATSEVRTEFRAKSPTRMDFGRLFYHFVHDYNVRNPDDCISLVDEEGKPQHWVFYLKPTWYGTSLYIDPKYPMYVHGVTEDSVIICQRSAKQDDDWGNDDLPNKKIKKENDENEDNFLGKS